MSKKPVQKPAPKPATKFGGKGGSRDYSKLKEVKKIPTKGGYQ